MISDVHHVGIAGRDRAAALRFYSEALGLPVVKEGDAPARGARVALIAAGGSYLELVQPVSDGSPPRPPPHERGGGVHPPPRPAGGGVGGLWGPGGAGGEPLASAPDAAEAEAGTGTNPSTGAGLRA